MTPAPAELVTTFVAARKRNVYELARQWADSGVRADLERDAPDVQLGELATMAALADRLTGWLPLQVHRAILAGATPEQTAAACGADVATVADRWRQWADGQRDLRTADGSLIGITADEYDRVAPQLAEGPC
jgi:hypothetical protein